VHKDPPPLVLKFSRRNSSRTTRNSTLIDAFNISAAALATVEPVRNQPVRRSSSRLMNNNNDSDGNDNNNENSNESTSDNNENDREKRKRFSITNQVKQPSNISNTVIRLTRTATGATANNSTSNRVTTRDSSTDQLIGNHSTRSRIATESSADPPSTSHNTRNKTALESSAALKHAEESVSYSIRGRIRKSKQNLSYLDDSDEEEEITLPATRAKTTAKPIDYNNKISNNDQSSYHKIATRNNRSSTESEHHLKQNNNKRLDPELKKQMQQIIQYAEQIDENELFAQPVDAEEAPQYYDIIIEPMDLQTVRYVNY
jgi:CRISPR/Cas system-associated endonuclease Cas3-HD